MAWQIEYRPSAVKDLKKVDRVTQRRVVEFFKNRIAPSEDPRSIGKPLTGNKQGFWRYRIGSYRVFCSIEDDVVTVLVLRVLHRGKAYK
ncbi:MAG: type II toxin-antitoxin system RelE/ParE family toxin [Magnetococcales bacterium]|nr:type II toxin-antitoxin system RelE/ParE family toxin [Magnetococcales bacterium]